jgi:hypothetical protein
MVNHPSRSQQDPSAALRRLINGNSLAGISIHVSRDGFSAKAMPDGFHPMVAKRREAAFAERSEWSIGEAQKINEASMTPVAHVFGKTLDETVAALKAALTPPSDS